MSFVMSRVGDRVTLNGEVFSLSDILSVAPSYDKKSYNVHYYDGRKHYVSDGMDQLGCEVPYPLAEELAHRLPEIKMCRSQREMDTKYFENLQNGRR
jgi:hypothetical protein